VIGIYLTEEVNDLYTDNYIALIKKLKKTMINGRRAGIHTLKELLLKYL
jgi:hypothetical protein